VSWPPARQDAAKNPKKENLLKRSFRIHHSTLLFLLLASAIFTGTMQAANLLTLTPSTISLNCNSTTGPATAVTVNVKPVTAPTLTATLAVTLNAAPTGVTISSPGVTTFSVANANSVAGINYTFNAAAACAAFTTSSTPITFKFKASAIDDASLTVNTTLNPASNLTVTPSPVVVTCVYNGSYTVGAAQTATVTSPTAGVAFTVGTGGNAPPAWLTVGTPSSGTTTSTFTVVAAAGCNSFPLGTSNSTSFHLVHASSTAMTDKVVQVTLKIVSTSSLTLTPTTASLTYAKGSGTPGFKDVSVGASSGTPFFSVDTSSLPIWLTVDSISGNASAGAPKSLRFSSTSVADALAPGSYSGSVHLKVSGQDDKLLPVTLQVNNPAARLTVSEGQTRNYSWTVGQSAPTYNVTVVSSGSAIPYSITNSGPLSPTIDSHLSNGLAYSFGTPIPVTFPPDVFAAAQAGSTLTGTVSITWGNPSSTTVVTFNITVLSPGATLTAITPAALPTGTPGTTQTVFLTGTGFIPSTDPNQKTRVGIWAGNTFVPHASLSANVINASNIALTITVPSALDTALPFALGGPVTLAVCNPVGVTCPVGTGATQSFSIGSNPTVQVVTSASAYVQVSPGVNQTVAPFDMLSIFGFNFCASCSSSQVLYGTPDAITLRYPAILVPDSNSPTVGLRVGFYQHGTSTLIAYAPLLFGTNNQINLLIPQGVSTYAGSTVDIVVSFAAKSNSLTPTVVNVATTNPGVFTVGADGQGDGAILDPNYAVVGSGNPAAARSTGTDSDIIAVYMTGLGIPDSDGTGSSWEATCIDLATYMSALNSATSSSLTTLDGDVILRSLLPSGKIAPCTKSSGALVPTVTIGGVPATVKYAGWVADSIAGLYQVNVQLPATTGVTYYPNYPATTGPITTITVPVQLPVLVTAGGKTSQNGVMVWVAPRLKVVAPAALTGKVGAAWASSGNIVLATEGTSTYTYMLTAGLLPSGLTLDSSSGAIAGTPALYTTGSYPITVSVTDSAVIPVTGTVSFTLVVNGGLFMTPAGPSPYTVGQPVSGTAAVTQVIASGGSGTYTYAITSGSPPAGMAIDASGNITIISTTPKAGPTTVTVTGTDTVTSLTGTFTFAITVN
jgi:uncharacterized protein (TIGR03437 family)